MQISYDMNTERLASIISQEPGYVRADLANLVDEEQIPGSFGDLIKQSIGIADTNRLLEQANTNVVSFYRKVLK